MSIPLFLFMTSVTFIDIISSSIIGKYYEKQFTTIGRAQNFLLISFFSLLHSFSAGFENLGCVLLEKKEYKKLKKLFNIAIISNLLLSIFLVAFQMLINPLIFNKLYDFKIVNYNTYIFYIYMIVPSSIFISFINVYMRYFSILNKTYVVAICFIVGALFNLLFSYVLAVIYKKDIWGLVISNYLFNIVVLIMFNILSIFFDDYNKKEYKVKFFSRETFNSNDIIKYLKFTFKTFPPLYILWINVTILSLIVNKIPDDNQYYSSIIVGNIYAIAYSFLFAYEVSLSISISKHLISYTNLVKKLLLKTFFIGLVFIFIIMIIIFILRYNLFSLFYDNDNKDTHKDIINVSKKCLNIAILCYFVDFLQITCAGYLRGLGLNHITIIVTSISSYIITLPMCCILVFVYKFGLSAVYISLMIGYILSLFAYVILILKVDINYRKETMLNSC